MADDLERDIRRLRLSEEKSLDEIKKLHAAVAELKRTETRLRQDIDTRDARLNGERNTNANLRRDLDAALSEAKDLQFALDEARSLQDVLRKESDDWKEKLDKVRAELLAQSKEFRRTLDEQARKMRQAREDEVNRLHMQMTAYIRLLQSTERKVDQLQEAKQADLKEYNEKVKSQQEQHAADMQEVAFKHAEQTRKLTLKLQLAQDEAKRPPPAPKPPVDNARLAQAHKELDRKESELRALQQTCDEEDKRNKQRIAKKDAELQAARNQITQLQSDVEHAKESLHAVTASDEEATRRRATELQTARAALQTIEQQREMDRFDLQREREAFAADLARRQAALDDCLVQSGRKQEALDKCRASLQDCSRGDVECRQLLAAAGEDLRQHVQSAELAKRERIARLLRIRALIPEPKE